MDTSIVPVLPTAADPAAPVSAIIATAPAHQTVAEAEMTASANAGDEATTIHGILIVHGIGNQRQSDILLDIGEPLHDWLATWYRARGQAMPDLEKVVLNFDPVERGDADGPAYAALNLPNGDRWVLAEAWWAASVRRQSFGRMLGWSSKHLFRAARSLVFGAWERLTAVGSDPAAPGEPLDDGRAPATRPRFTWAWWYRYVLAIYYQLTLLVFLLALVVGSPLILAIILLAQIPFSPLRNALYSVVGTFLEVNLGEFRTIFEDEIQSANMRRRLAGAVTALVDLHKCKELTIVAHSGGAVVSFDMLADKHNAKVVEPVRKLITVGSGLNKAWLLAPELKRLHGPLPGHIHWVDIWATMDPAPSDPAQFPPDPLHPGHLIEVFQPDPAVVKAQYLTRRRSASMLAQHRTRPHPDAIYWPESVRCTNELSVVTDHWIYWENDEEALARIVAEIDSEYYRDSPFWRGDHPRASDEAVRALEGQTGYISAPFEAPQRRGIQRRRERVIQLACVRMVALSCWALLEGLLAGSLARWLLDHRDSAIPLPRSLVGLLVTVDSWLADRLRWFAPLGEWLTARPLLVAAAIVTAIVSVALVAILLFFVIERINAAMDRGNADPRRVPWVFAGFSALLMGVPWLVIFVPLLSPWPVFWTIAAFLLGVPVLGGLNAYRFFWARRDARERKAFITSLAMNGR